MLETAPEEARALPEFLAAQQACNATRPSSFFTPSDPTLKMRRVKLTPGPEVGGCRRPRAQPGGDGPLASRCRRVSPTSRGEAVPGPDLWDQVALGGAGAQVAPSLRVPQRVWPEPVLGQHGETAPKGGDGEGLKISSSRNRVYKATGQTLKERMQPLI